ncbi:unnamed protein product [Cylicocyclus nassatus]|uniref:Uncharacterized protein n=1 Tax=Cylicocyclus nassatus TaxID=53992 RepID=A0AA36MCY6_CYLNA|nr:unnamed protein product [Cylicocyclus nassatus]
MTSSISSTTSNLGNAGLTFWQKTLRKQCRRFEDNSWCEWQEDNMDVDETRVVCLLCNESDETCEGLLSHMKVTFLRQSWLIRMRYISSLSLASHRYIEHKIS